jgi:hypothetical protein
MRGKKRIGFLAILVSMLFALVGSGVAHAATWTPGPVRWDGGDAGVCGSDYSGLVQVKARFDRDDSDPARVRLNSDYDIIVINQSAARIKIYASGNTPSFSWYSLMNPQKQVSSYTHPDGILHVPPFSNEVFLVDNPDRWKREDGVTDSDPSPHGTPMVWSTRNPALEAIVYVQIYYSGAWHTCANIIAELTWEGSPGLTAAQKAKLLADFKRAHPMGPIDGD